MRAECIKRARAVLSTKNIYIYQQEFHFFSAYTFFFPIMCVFVPLRFRSSLFSLSFFIKFGMNLYKEPKKGKKRKKSRSSVTTHACVCSAFKIQEKKVLLFPLPFYTTYQPRSRSRDCTVSPLASPVSTSFAERGVIMIITKSTSRMTE